MLSLSVTYQNGCCSRIFLFGCLGTFQSPLRSDAVGPYIMKDFGDAKSADILVWCSHSGSKSSDIWGAYYKES